MAKAETARQVRVTGRVQGVNFRAWVAAEARARGLAGWVRNEPDGSVAALLAGGDAPVAELVAALRTGPPAARVEDVTSAPAEPDGAGADFRILG